MKNKHLVRYLVLGALVAWGSCATEPGTAPDGSVIVPGSGGTATGGNKGTGGTGGVKGTGGNQGGTGGIKGTGGNQGGTGGVKGSGGNQGGSGGGNGSVGTCSGYATRFWDCCKPHCGWSANVPSGVNPMNSCSKTNQTLSGYNQASSCSGGDAHTCWGLIPWAVNSNLAYGFAATSSGDICGRCFQLSFTGSSFNAGNDPGSKALGGKTMIVQALNVGYDVGNGQFDLLVPGGGVGAFNACSSQWGVPNSELGAQYGGLLAGCKQTLGGSASLDQYKSCVTQKCTSVFGSRGLTQLETGCKWFADWFQAADNPALKFKEVACPSEITSKSGMNRTSRNDINKNCG